MKFHSFSVRLLILFPLLIALMPGTPVVQMEDQHEDKFLARIEFRSIGELNQLASSVDVWEVNHAGGYVIAYLDNAEFDELTLLGYAGNIDRQRTLQLDKDHQLLPDQTQGIPGYPCYRTVEETYTSLADLAAANPQLAAWIDIGDSWEKSTSSGMRGYDINTLVLTNKTIPGPKPKFFLMGAIHAREYVTAELATRFAEYLVNGYGVDADITWLLDYYEVHITPITNPDGRKLAETGIYWRKNTNNTDGCEDPGLWGSDLNRNSNFKWGLTGSSQNACAETFRGASPGSEPETQAIQDYLSGIFTDRRGPADNDPAPADTSGLFITLHSYGDLVFYPWAWTGTPAPNNLELQTLGRKFGFYSGYQVCQSAEPGCLYSASGNTDDWAYGQLGLAAFTFELGGAFFESCSYFEEQIIAEQLPALLYAFKAARLPYQNPAGPEAINLASSAERVTPGADLMLSFSADDTRYNSSGWGQEPSQPVNAARFTIDAPSWLSSSPPVDLQPADGVFDEAVEEFTFSIDTQNFEIGRHTIFVEAMDEDGNWGVPSAKLVWVTTEQFQPDFEPDLRYAHSSPATELVYSVELANAGTQNDSFDIQLMGNSWPTSLSQESVGPLIPGESSLLTVMVTIPASAQPGDQDLATLIATSQGDPGQFSHALITSSTRAPHLFLPDIAR